MRPLHLGLGEGFCMCLFLIRASCFLGLVLLHFLLFIVFGHQFQFNQFCGKTCFQNDLLYVKCMLFFSEIKTARKLSYVAAVTNVIVVAEIICIHGS